MGGLLYSRATSWRAGGCGVNVHEGRESDWPPFRFDGEQLRNNYIRAPTRTRNRNRNSILQATILFANRVESALTSDFCGESEYTIQHLGLYRLRVGVSILFRLSCEHVHVLVFNSTSGLVGGSLHFFYFF